MEKSKRGRKNKYETVIKPRENEIKKLIAEGKSEKQIAKYLGVSYTTWKTHKAKISAFSSLIEDSRKGSIEDLEGSMFNMAMGFTKKVKKAMKLKTIEYEDGKKVKEEERIEFYEEEIYIAPSSASAQFLLKNWAKNKYSNNPAELDQKKEEFEHKKKIDEDNFF